MKFKILLFTVLLSTTLTFSQRNPNATYMTSFAYKAKDGMVEKPLANPVANGQTLGRDQHIVAHDAPPRLCWRS